MQSAARPLRLFLAIWPDEPLRDAIAAWQRDWTWPPRAGLVKRERLHLTLHFLGDVQAERLPALVRALSFAFEPFELDLGHGEVWPVGVAVLRPASVPPALSMLHAALRRELAALELPVEDRPYRPHVTLARRAHGARPPAREPALRWVADSGYVLVRSLPGGAGYEILQRWR